jgi:hypothetical protein
MKELCVFDPATMVWSNLTTTLLGKSPSFRSGHGFTAAGDKLYVFGGIAGSDGTKDKSWLLKAWRYSLSHAIKHLVRTCANCLNRRVQ